MFVSQPTASILHADLDAFYASVEQRDDPTLRDRPVIVGGGVVLAASYEARRYGVRTAMSGREARLRCPQALVVPPRMSAYSAASKAVFAVFADTTPVVEALSIDEAFLDVSGLAGIAGPAVDIAVRLRQRVRAEVGLPITVGIARTKFLAKVASGVGKPDGLLMVEPDRELEFLHPLPVGRLWGVGPVTAEKLSRLGIRTVGEVAAMAETELVAVLGPASGRHLHALAHNRDPRPVQVGRRRRSVGAQSALGRPRHALADIEPVLEGLVDRVCGRMRKAGRAGRTVTLRLRFGDYRRVTRSHTLPMPTAQTATVQRVALGLLQAMAEPVGRDGLTLVGVAVEGLDDSGAIQLALPFDRYADGALDIAMDEVHARFGTKLLTRGVLVGRDAGISVPLLPD